MNRKFLISAIKLLDRANLVMEFYQPEKLYLHNTNLIYALGKKNAEIGALRETFFANQLRNVHEIHLAGKGDFLVDGKYTFEVGGKGKDSKQIQGVQNPFIVRDELEVGVMNIIPLWLFGFLY